MTEMVLIRHGETAENLAGILQGHYDSELNEAGLIQAQAVARRLAGETFDAFYASDLKRAAGTAEVISRQIGMDFTPLKNLREWHLGELEGKEVKLLQQKYPEVMDSFKHEPAGDVPVPGGESYYDFYMRIAGSMIGLANKHENQRILLVTHGGVLRMVFRMVFDSLPRTVAQPLLSNTGYTKIRKNDAGEWQLCTWNDTGHLNEDQHREQKAF
jgi:probable phosphoglycerate mutase